MKINCPFKCYVTCNTYCRHRHYPPFLPACHFYTEFFFSHCTFFASRAAKKPQNSEKSTIMEVYEAKRPWQQMRPSPNQYSKPRRKVKIRIWRAAIGSLVSHCVTVSYFPSIIKLAFKGLNSSKWLNVCFEQGWSFFKRFMQKKAEKKLSFTVFIAVFWKCTFFP